MRNDLTAAEIAAKCGYSHLAQVLAPVIHHPIPHDILAGLQALFHAMIREDYKKASDLVLPQLVSLTELKVPEMWFPLENMGTNEHVVVGFLSLLTKNA